jgi:hypothetical protein
MTSSLAPLNTSDKNLVSIRVGESDNFAHTPMFSQDHSLVLFSEDFNNVFTTDRFLTSISASDFDVMVSRSDGFGQDTRLQLSGTQAFPSVTSGGVRVVYGSYVDGAMHLLMAPIVAFAPVKGTAQANNGVQTAAAMKVTDGSGSFVSIPSGAFVAFPQGTAQEIEVSTPVQPVETAQLPANIADIPVVRTIGPEGSSFNPAATLNVAYTDAEIRGLEESGLRVFRMNPVSGAFDQEVTAGIARDPGKNRITFPVGVSGTYGIGASAHDVK